MNPAMPSPATERPIGIVVAVQEELRAILKRMSPAVVDSAGGFQFHQGLIGGKHVVLAKSGMGGSRARALVESLIQIYNPRAVIIAGFCAGLEYKLRPGELVLAEAVFD